MRLRELAPALALLLLLLGGIAYLGSGRRGASVADDEDGAGAAPTARRFKRYEALPSGVYNSKLGNATIRAELGRSTWTLLHTIAARYADEPSPEQQEDTLQFIYLLSKLYPCGDCAREFQALLALHPPELASKDTFIAWLCRVHNVVNERLGKPAFDCATVRSRWTCGCVSEV